MTIIKQYLLIESLLIGRLVCRNIDNEMNTMSGTLSYQKFLEF